MFLLNQIRDRSGRFAATLLFCVGLVSLPFSDAQSADAGSYVPITSLFDGEELAPVSLNAFLRWGEVLRRHDSETRSNELSCDRGFLNRCRFLDWVEFLRSIDGKNAWTQLSEVNRYINRLPYAADRSNYGSKDYWATPRQFFIGRVIVRTTRSPNSCPCVRSVGQKRLCASLAWGIPRGALNTPLSWRG